MELRTRTTIAGIALVALAAVGCTGQQEAINQAKSQAEHRAIPGMPNDTEYKNYVRRLTLADDPSVILFCTAFPKNSAVEPITFPIQGKLTSSGKRPWADTSGVGPDGMYGTSVEYRYGWTPGGTYVDFTGMDTICTTELTAYQRDSTVVITE